MTTTDDGQQRPVSPVKIQAAVRRATKKAAAAPKDKRKTKPGQRNLGPSLEVQAAVLVRRNQAMGLLLAGHNYVQIGRALTRPDTAEGYDPNMDDADLAAVVRSDIKRVMDATRVDLYDKVSTHRRMMTDRHYYLLSKVWPAAEKNDHDAIHDAQSLMAAIIRLNGLNEPARVAVGPDTPAVVAAYQAIVELARREAAGETFEPTEDEIGSGADYHDLDEP